ncbi:GNAT family N-acetyltransferase [Thioclava sp. GXIMD4215]|uniref:bifunctional helix-turn-helix transcriptional regulator/GNAT family N-acetyltransferase n=1 Tax=Thioclava sp. GXIMD4215 TaxID=3131928 RepID=UPI00324A873F
MAREAEPAVKRLRRFNRVVTLELGALDQSFLGRGRPLLEARVLHAVGSGVSDVGDLRERLNLDSGLMSRLLRKLEAEELIVLSPDPKDGRRKRILRTRKGEREFDAYEALSDQAAQTVLNRVKDKEEFLKAVDLVASVIGRERIEIVEVDPDDARAIACVNAYVAELSRRFGEDFDRARSGEPEADAMRPPRGTFLLALSEGVAMGCVAVKDMGERAEIKRLWVDPSARGMRLAHRLMREAETRAYDLGHRELVLDTSARLPEARAFYLKTGWGEIARYNDNPYADHFFGKEL